MEHGHSGSSTGSSHRVANDSCPGGNAQARLPANTDSHRNSGKEDQEWSDKTRIGFLNRCKLELSAEVIRWKEENLKLRKENEAAVKKIEELQSANNKLTRQNYELESNLFLSWEENKRLRMRTLAIGEENSLLHEKLSKSKFLSYPCLELRKQMNAHSTHYDTPKASSLSPPTESWEEVSKKLFLQMQQEMREVQRLSLTVCDDQGDESPAEVKPEVASAALHGEETLKCEAEAAEQKVSELISQSEMLKRQLKLQNEKLRFLLNHSNTGFDAKQSKGAYSDGPTVSSKDNMAVNINPGVQCTHDEKFTRPSDETFRAYFTQQLSNNRNGEDMRRIMQAYFRVDSKSANKTTDTANSSAKVVSSATSPAPVLKPAPYIKAPVPETPKAKQINYSDSVAEKKICPICEYIFSKSFPYNQFEAHVIAHLEDVSASLLEEYETSSPL